MKGVAFVFAILFSLTAFSEDDFKVERISKLNCMAVNFFGFSQIQMDADSKVSMVTNNMVKQEVKISNAGNNPLYKFGYINLTLPGKKEVISLMFPTKQITAGVNNLMNGNLFIGQVLNPFQPNYAGVPWAIVNCELEIK